MSDTIATLRGTATKIELTTGEATLVIEVAVDCPICGPHTLRFAGHHLRTLRDLVIEFIDLHPALAGPETRDAVRERIEGTTGNPILN